MIIVCYKKSTASNSIVRGRVTDIDASDVTYDNTTSGLTATNAQEAIDEVADRVDAHTLAENIDISSYTQANPYIVPSDGYVTAIVPPNVANHIMTILSSGTTASLAGSNGASYNQNVSVFVKKGMPIYRSATASAATLNYKAFS